MELIAAWTLLTTLHAASDWGLEPGGRAAGRGGGRQAGKGTGRQGGDGGGMLTLILAAYKEFKFVKPDGHTGFKRADQAQLRQARKRLLLLVLLPKLLKPLSRCGWDFPATEMRLTKRLKQFQVAQHHFSPIFN